MNGLFQKALLFFFFLQILNVVSIIYEIYFLELSLAQVVVVRTTALLTDILETYLFIFVNIDINKILVDKLGLHEIKRKDIFYGLKLSLIAPNIYIIKFIFTNIVLIPIILYFGLMDIDYIANEILFQAYITTFVLSFIMGFMYCYLEAKMFHIKNMVIKKKK